jgi:hypothetical protein
MRLDAALLIHWASTAPHRANEASRPLVQVECYVPLVQRMLSVTYRVYRSLATPSKVGNAGVCVCS